MATQTSSTVGKDRQAVKIRLSLKPSSVSAAGTSSTVPSNSGIKHHHVVEISPTMTFAELNVMSRELFFQQHSTLSTATTTSSEGLDIEYWTGYPPKRLLLITDPMSLAQTLVQDYIQGGENVLVNPLTLAERLPIHDSPSKPTKRKAAVTAQANFIHQIHAQEQLLQQDRTKNKRSQGASRQFPITSTSTSSNSSRIHSFQDNLISPSKTRSTPHHHHHQQQKKDETISHMDTEEKMSVSLLSLFQPGSTTTHEESKNFKASLRQAVISAHEERIATIRFASISGDAFHESKSTIILLPHDEHQEQEERQRNNTPSTKSLEKDSCTRTSIYSLNPHVPTQFTCGTFFIRYPKGMEGRGYFEDEIEILTLSTLQQVVSSVYHMDKDDGEDILPINNNTGLSTGQDLLRPRNIALLSPRVFWSLWFHYKHGTSSMEEALQQLLPNLDWNYLWTTPRIREMSEKAKENQRQEWMLKHKRHTHHDHDTDDNEYQAIKHISDIENAMEFFLQNKQKRKRVARTKKTTTEGHTLGGTRNIEKKTWILNTPSELDIDELVDCMTEGIESKIEKRTLLPIFQEYAQILSTSCYIRNWRELANILQVSDLYNTFHIALTTEGTRHVEDFTTESQIEQWIEVARMRSIDEIMLEILDGDDDIYFTLREKLQCGTPKDLRLWKNIPWNLLSELKPFLEEVNKSQDAVTEEMIDEWCERADIALHTCAWLDDYITPLA